MEPFVVLGPPLRLRFDSLLRVGRINPKRSSLPVGIAGQLGRSPLLLRLNKEKRWFCHQVTGRSPAPLCMALETVHLQSLPASTAPRFSLHDQVPVLDLISHNTVMGLSWPTFILNTPSWSPPLGSELTISMQKDFALDLHRSASAWLLSPQGVSPWLSYLLSPLF